MSIRMRPAPTAGVNGRNGGDGGAVGKGDAPAAVEGDIELARQAVELAVVQDVVMHRPAIRGDVEQLVRAEPMVYADIEEEM